MDDYVMSKYMGIDMPMAVADWLIEHPDALQTIVERRAPFAALATLAPEAGAAPFPYLSIIKATREVSGVGLREAKERVDRIIAEVATGRLPVASAIAALARTE
jgi:hypothetical protein